MQTTSHSFTIHGLTSAAGLNTHFVPRTTTHSSTTHRLGTSTLRFTALPLPSTTFSTDGNTSPLAIPTTQTTQTSSTERFTPSPLPSTIFSVDGNISPLASPTTQTSTISSSNTFVPDTQNHGKSATTSPRRTTLVIPIGVSLGAIAAVIVILIFLRWRRRKRSRQPPIPPDSPFLEGLPPSTVRPYITTQHSQTSNSALTLPTQPSSSSLAATSATNSKARRRLLTAGVTPPPLITIPSAADSVLPDQNALLAERLEEIQERLYQIESITRIGFIAEEVPPPEYASNRASSTRGAGDERGAGGVGDVARAVGQGTSDGSRTLVGVERPVEE
ncbi:hypothetical protein GALMADRAFT_1304131 [Galerina marginata CBS 339.88]|uniref:Mid2 domain-containing protein n=1 Tax=Galerina marginata (strain CBS 339.88) TaxID=685588 RepID=A0A067TE27_GALM3|nr:hypothetical protein GALMADRAFT_1304131 [Galerina marginata CBS 339.88]